MSACRAPTAPLSAVAALLALPSFLALLAPFACKRDDATSAAPNKAAAAAAPSSAPKVDANRKLALAPPVGATPVDKTIARLQTSIGRNPKKADFWVLLGRAWVRKAREAADPGYYLNANAAAQVALEMSPDDKLALDLRALVLLNDHKFEEARLVSQKIVDKHPDDPAAYATLADALFDQGKLEQSAAATQKMMDLKPNLPAYSRASYIRWIQGDTMAAKSIVRQAIDAGRDARDPEPEAWVLVQAAMIFWHEGDYEGADAGFERALQVFKEYPHALVGKGRVALALGDPKRAVELLDRAHKLSPLVETAWLLGDARAAAGDTKGADEAYAAVVKEGRLGDGRTLSLFLSTKNRSQAERKEALDLIEVERKTRGDLYTDDAYAWALYVNGKHAEAKTAIDHALRHGTRDARLLYHSGAIRIALGEVGPGKKLLRDALALNPKFDVTGSAQAEAVVGKVPPLVQPSGSGSAKPAGSASATRK